MAELSPADRRAVVVASRVGGQAVLAHQHPPFIHVRAVPDRLELVRCGGRTRVSLQLQSGLSIGIAAVGHDSPAAAGSPAQKLSATASLHLPCDCTHTRQCPTAARRAVPHAASSAAWAQLETAVDSCAAEPSSLFSRLAAAGKQPLGSLQTDPPSQPGAVLYSTCCTAPKR